MRDREISAGVAIDAGLRIAEAVGICRIIGERQIVDGHGIERGPEFAFTFAPAVRNQIDPEDARRQHLGAELVAVPRQRGLPGLAFQIELFEPSCSRDGSRRCI